MNAFLIGLAPVMGAWFVGLSVMRSSDALVATAPGVLPSFNPMTRVGVF